MPNSKAPQVERLVERVQSSTLLDDRRDACRALKALSRKYRVEVGAQGMEALRFILEVDKQDCEIVGYALDTLCNIMYPNVFEEEEPPEAGQDALLHVGEQFTEMFLKKTENVTLILGFLEEYDFKVRWPALKLLTTLLTNRLRDIQEIILVSPMGVSKLMDLLGDSREVIRNDALLLLIELTKSNANIQKIVAFENAFDRLFDVIIEEGCADGGIVVEDCFILMFNLLKNNTSNQNFFKEGSYIQKLCPMFAIPPDGIEDWSPQKSSILMCVLKVIRCLVSPSNPGQVTSACQKALFSSGIIQALCSIMMASGVPVGFLSEVICTLSEALRGNQFNQEHFSTVMAPSNPPREAIVILLMSMINEKQSFELRCSVLYCFQCYLFKNEVRQAKFVQTLLSPAAPDVNRVTCGHLLCSGLFSHDSLTIWLSSVALSHALIDNPVQREHFLKVLLAPDPNSSPVTLVHQVALLLQQSSKVQSKMGFLILLSTWLSHCHLAVKHFLEVPTAIPYLTAQAASTERGDDNEELVQGICTFLMGLCILFNDGSVPAYSKDSLLHLVSNRVGIEMFHSKLGEVSRHEYYSRASKQPQPVAKKPDELLLDHEFCKLFKILESMILKALSPKIPDGTAEMVENGLVSEYKDVIREQDRKLFELQTKLNSVEAERNELKANLDQMSATVSRLTDENTLLRAQVNGGVVSNPELSVQIDNWKAECARKDNAIHSLETELKRLHLTTAQIPCENPSAEDSEIRSQLHAQIDKLLKEQDDLIELLTDQERKLSLYQERLKEFGVEIVEDDDSPENIA